MGLKDKLVNWAFGETIRAESHREAERIVRQASASSGVDPDDRMWRGILRTRRDLDPVDQDRLIDIANYLSAQNPLASAIIDTRRDFVIGDGVTFDAEDKKIIQPLIDQFTTDPENNWDEFQFDLVKYLSVNGELLLPTFVNDFSGQVRLGWIDPYEVERVVADRHNRRVMRQVVMKPGATAGSTDYYTLSERRSYTIASVDTESRSRTFGYRVGDLLYFRTNCAPDAKRGRSDTESWGDLADQWDQFNYTNLERARMLNHFIWDVLLKGKSEQEIEDWLRKQSPPQPGSTRAHNENVEWKAEAPDLKATESTALSDSARRNALGAARLSDFFFGVTEGANRASSENLDVPILRGLASRQRKVKAIFREIIDFQIDQTALHRPVIKAKLEGRALSRKFDVAMPELSVRDLSRVGSIISTVTAAIDTALARGWITNETAARAFGSLMAQLGVEYDVDDELGKGSGEMEKRETTDYTPERIEQLRRVV